MPLSHRQSLALWLVPLLALRLLLPAGIMPTATIGGLYLGYCTGSATGNSSALIRDSREKPQSPDHSQPCPFALAASIAPPPTLQTARIAPVEAPPATGPTVALPRVGRAARQAHPPRAPPPSLQA